MSTVSIAGGSITLRPSGIGRYFGAVFLTVWLCGWALGEVFALGFLILLVRSVVGSVAGWSWPVPGGDWITGGAAGLVFLVVLIWLALWTFGGVAALTELLRSLAGEDRVAVASAGLELERRAGPFRRLRTFERATIRRVRLRAHDKAVVIDTASGTVIISSYGTLDERRAMAEWLRARLLLPDARVDPMAPPAGWSMTIDGGTAYLSRIDPQTRRTASLIMSAIAAFTGLIWFGSTPGLSPGSLVALALTMVTAAGAAWVTWSRREWLVRHSELAARTSFLLWRRERSFKSARLDVTISTDSDNDDHYALTVKDAEGARQIASEINDEAGIVDLGRWLSARTGFPLTLPRQLQ